jgi:hypothetical protein
MLRYIRSANPQQISADIAAATSTAGAGWAWLAHVNEILTLIATLVAIVSGLYAIRYHARKRKDDAE